MNYISSADIYRLIKDTLSYIDPRVMDHGYRVAYFVEKMLECKGGYEEYELADIVMLVTLHDIGAYGTENLGDMLKYENKDTMAHSIYGYLFLKHLSPIGDRAKVLLYHHVDYEQLSTMHYEDADLASYINIAEKMDIYFNALGNRFDIKMFHKMAGKKLSPQGLELFYQTNAKYDVLNKLRSGKYRDEMDEIISYMIFTNLEKKKYLEMLMFCMEFRSEAVIRDVVKCITICEELANRLKFTEEDMEQLYYAALLHDIGMLGIDHTLIDANRKLTSEEMETVRGHVELMSSILNGKMQQSIIQIAVAHHERLDGSGYPFHLKDIQMTDMQKVLQVADVITAMTSARPYRMKKEKIEVISVLITETDMNHLSRHAVNMFTTNYDAIMKRVDEETESVLITYHKLNTQYEQFKEQFHA